MSKVLSLELDCSKAVNARHLPQSGLVQGLVPWVLPNPLHLDRVSPLVCPTWFFAGAGLTKQRGRELLLLLPMQPVRGKEGIEPNHQFLVVLYTHACIADA